MLIPVLATLVMFAALALFLVGMIVPRRVFLGPNAGRGKVAGTYLGIFVLSTIVIAATAPSRETEPQDTAQAEAAPPAATPASPSPPTSATEAPSPTVSPAVSTTVPSSPKAEPKTEPEPEQVIDFSASPPTEPITPTTATKGPPQYVTAGGYPACVTEEAFDEAVKALVARDEQWFSSIDGCVITRGGLKLVILDHGWGTSKVKLFTNDGEAITVWTNTENIKQR